MHSIFHAIILSLIFITYIEVGSCSRSFRQSVRSHCTFAAHECPNQQIQFWLYTSETASPILLDPLLLNAQHFAQRRPLKVLIHGYTGHRDHSPNAEVRPVLLQTQPVHVLSVDYGTLARNPCYYPWAVRNAHIVAKCLAQLLNNLSTSGLYKSEDFHLIGFSLGAQIAGLTANYMQNELNRITGLDPARPGFVTANNDGKLDASDARFVDVIHTDPFFYAMHNPTGHVDFYPNLENFYQAGCSYWQDGALRNCNHYRAPVYYAESITTKTGFWSYACGNWLEFLLQNCSKYAHLEYALMGYFIAENATGSYFLTTNPEAPFAKGFLYAAEVELEVSDKLQTIEP